MVGRLKSILKITIKHIKGIKIILFLGIIKLITTIPSPLIQKYILDAIPTKNFDLLIKLALILLVLGFVQIVIEIIYKFVFSKSFQLSLFSFRKEVLYKIYHSSSSDYKKYYSAFLLNSIYIDTEQLQNFTYSILFSIIENLLMFICGLVICLSINVKITLIILILIPSLFILYNMFKNKLFEYNLKVKETTSLMYSKVSESLGIHHLVKKHCWEELEIKKFSTYFYNMFNLIKKQIIISSTFNSIASSIGLVISLAILILGSLEIYNNNMTMGGLLAINSSISFIITPLYFMINTLEDYQSSLASYHRLSEILSIRQEESGEVKIGGINSIALKDIHFTYGTKEIISGLSYNFTKGHIYGIIGDNGSGKSTLVNLILKLENLLSGDICINDTSINLIDNYSLRKSISLIEQDVVLFNDTLYNNIIYGNEHVSEEKVSYIINKINLNKWISKLPNGIDTIINESSYNISGGQKQKIAIARALLKNTDVVIMDEPSTGLDSSAQSELKNILLDLKENKIVLIVTHNKELEELCDYIVQL